MKKLPALHIYGGDWRKDPGVQSLDYFNRGVWFELLLFMHESEDRGKLVRNGKAIPDDQIIRMLGLDNQTGTKALTTLLETGVADRDPETGALMSRRMVRDESLRKVRQEVGKLGGNPNLVKQNPTTMDNRSLKMKMNMTVTSSSGEESEENPPPDQGEAELAAELGHRSAEFRAVHSEWVEYRTPRSKPRWTAANFARQLRGFKAYPDEAVIAAMRQSLANNYQGLFPEKFVNAGRPAPKQQNYTSFEEEKTGL